MSLRKNNLVEHGYREYVLMYDSGYEEHILYAHGLSRLVLPSKEELEFVKFVAKRQELVSTNAEEDFLDSYYINPNTRTGYYDIYPRKKVSKKISKTILEKIKLQEKNGLYEKERVDGIVKKEIILKKEFFIQEYKRGLVHNIDCSEFTEDLMKTYGEENTLAVLWLNKNDNRPFFNIEHGGKESEVIYHFNIFFKKEKKLVDIFSKDVFIGTVEEYQKMLTKLNNDNVISYEFRNEVENINIQDLLLIK